LGFWTFTEAQKMQNLLPNNVLVRKIPLGSLAKSDDLLFIQAAGRAISGKNAGRIKDAWATLTNLLVEHEWLDKNYLMPEKKAEETGDSPEILAADKKAMGTSSIFLKSVQAQTWIESLRIALYGFGSEFQDFLDATPERLGMLTRRSTLSRDELVSNLIDDLKTFLEGHAIAAPEMGANGGGIPSRYAPYDGAYRGADRAIWASEKSDAEKGSPETTSLQAAMFGDKSLKDTIDQLSWRDRLATTLRVFSWQFHSVCCVGEDDDEEMETEAEEAAERQSGAAGLIKDLLDVLNQLCKDHPAIGSGSSPYASLQLSASDVDSQKVEIELSAFQVVLADDSSEEVNLNRHPVEGILFRVDEASEGIPSIGPGLPLYIPSAVAQECLSQVSGLPLDAHDTLTKHAQEEPTGVMLSASISGKDFCIKGLLWPWNKADKVTAIKAAKGSLGMSMNAAAIGHEVTLNAGTSNAQKVFWITKLILLGANILYAARATYKQTRLSAEEKEAAPSAWDLSQVDGDEATEADEFRRSFAPDSRMAIAASESDTEEFDAEDSNHDENTTGQLTMNTELIEAELSQISRGLESLTKLTSDLDTIQGAVRTQGEMLVELMASYRVIQEERNEAIQKVQASAREEEAKASQDSLMELIRSTIADTINPSGEPRRRTVSLQAQAAMTQQQRSNGGAGAAIDNVDLQIANLEGQILALQGSPNGGSTRLKLLDEVRGLRLQKQGV